MAVEQTIDLIIYIMIGLVALMAIGGMTLFVVLRKQYKHTFIRKIRTNGPPLIIIDKAKEFKDKDTGVIYWRLLDAKHTIGRPPAEALRTTKNGNYCAEAWYNGDIDYKYIASELSEDQKQELKDITDTAKGNLNASVFSIIRRQLKEIAIKRALDTARFKPSPVYVYCTDKQQILENDNPTITTNQRLIAYDQIKKAVERKTNGIMQYLPMIVGITALVMLVAVVFIFGGELIKPMVELNERNAQVVSKIGEISDKLSQTSGYLTSVIQERQLIESQRSGTVGALNGTLPPGVT